MSECQICGRKVDSETQFCQYHKLASANVTESFEKWRFAMGDIQWDEYLTKLSEEENLGRFARDVVEFLIQQDDSSVSP